MDVSSQLSRYTTSSVEWSLIPTQISTILYQPACSITKGPRK